MPKKYFLFILLLIGELSFCQEMNITINNNNTSFKEVIEYLEKKYDLRFSYKDEAINGKKITLNIKNGDLKELLTKLEEQTLLEINLVSNRYIIIKQKNNLLTICGYLYDKGTNQAIADATIRLETTKKVVYTNTEGYFKIEDVAPNEVIAIQHRSYIQQKKIATSLANTDCIKIALELSTTILEEVVIQNYLTQGISRKSNGSILITQSKLNLLPGLTDPDVLESIQWIPGVMSTSESVSELNIRGGKSDQNLILWDGMNIYQSDHFYGMLSAFNPYIIKKTSLFRNGASAQYGNRISGVIDIQTENEIPKKINGGLGFNMIHADGYIALPIVKEKLGVIVSARRSFTDVVPTFTYKSFSEKVFQNTRILSAKKEINEEYDEEYTELLNKFYFFDFHLKSIWKPSESNKITFNILNIKNNLKNNVEISQDTISNRDELKTKNESIGASWQKKWSNTLEQETKIYFTDYGSEYIHDLKDDGYNTLLYKNNNVTELGLHLTFNYNIKEDQFLIIGGQFNQNKVGYNLEEQFYGNSFENNKINDNSHSQIYSAFSEYKYTKEKNIFINAGLRINGYSFDTNFKFEPRLYIEKQLNRYFRAKLSGEIRSQAISQFIELNEDDLEMSNQIWVLSDNENIPIVDSQQIGTGILFSDSGWDIDMDIYYKKTNNISILNPKSLTATDPETIWYHFGSGIAQGMDFLVQKKYKNFNTSIGYSLSQTDYLFESIQAETFSANTNAKHNFRWSTSHKWDDLDFSTGFIWRSGIPYTQAIGITSTNPNDTVPLYDLEYGNINESILPNYYRLDCSASYRFYYSAEKKMRSRIGLSFLNILNHKNTINRSYKINYDSEPTIERIDKLSLGFTANVVFRLEW
jgi:hypothetical protein